MRNFKRSDRSDGSVKPRNRIRKIHDQDSSLLLTKDDRTRCTFDEWVSKQDRKAKKSKIVIGFAFALMDGVPYAAAYAQKISEERKTEKRIYIDLEENVSVSAIMKDFAELISCAISDMCEGLGKLADALASLSENRYGERNGKDSMQVLYQPNCR